MKVDSNNKSEDVVRNKNKRVSVRKEQKNSNIIMITLLPLISMVAAILPGAMQMREGVELIKIGVIVFLLTSAATFYIRMYADNILTKPYAKTIIVLTYLASIELMMLVPEPASLCFWMVGGLLVAMLLDQKLGLLLHFNLSFILGFTIVLRPETVIVVLIMGVLMSFLANALKQRATAIYASIIILSTNVTLAFVMNNFFLKSDTAYNYMNSLFSILGIIVIAFLLSAMYDKSIKKRSEDMLLAGTASSVVEAERNSQSGIKAGISQIIAYENTIRAQSLEDDAALRSENFKAESIDENLKQENLKDESLKEESLKKESMKEESLTEESLKEEGLMEALEEAEGSTLRNLGLRTSYEVLCDYNNVLLQRLKSQSETLFEHAVHISELSCRAAREIGADDLLAKVGGLYHEIGKINGKNYIEEGLLIAEEYAFPAELTSILKEHNIKYEKPCSIEAAIVMLSDSVVSTIEYIEKTNDHRFTANKIIDNIFQLRLDKGTFDSSKLSLKEFKVLKEFYMKEFQKEG